MLSSAKFDDRHRAIARPLIAPWGPNSERAVPWTLFTIRKPTSISTPSWGRMISEAQTYFAVAPWLVVVPGLAISLTVVGFNLIGYGLVDLLGTRKT